MCGFSMELDNTVRKVRMILIHQAVAESGPSRYRTHLRSQVACYGIAGSSLHQEHQEHGAISSETRFHFAVVPESQCWTEAILCGNQTYPEGNTYGWYSHVDLEPERTLSNPAAWICSRQGERSYQVFKRLRSLVPRDNPNGSGTEPDKHEETTVRWEYSVKLPTTHSNTRNTTLNIRAISTYSFEELPAKQSLRCHARRATRKGHRMALTNMVH